MLNDQDLDQAKSQLEEGRQQREQLQETDTKIWTQYNSLIEAYRRLKSDFEEERDSREKYKQIARGQERNPFVLVLVDGDGYVFNDDLISQGSSGGQRAARVLNEVVKESLCGRGLDHCRIMVRIYASLAGLSKAVSKIKLCGPEKRSLSSFAASFTRTIDLFDFIDAGDLKETADFKIRAMFRQFVENSQCRHIYFAACHDVGYISELTPYISNRDRITLVRNHAFHHEFTKLSLRSEEFPHVFRTSPLDTPASSKTTHPPTRPAASSTIALQNDGAPICVFYQKGFCKHGSLCRKQHVKSSLSPFTKPTALESNDRRNPAKNNRSLSPHQSSHLSYNETELIGGQANLSGPIDFASMLLSLGSIPKGCIAVNGDDHRLDPYIPPPAPEDRALFHARHKKHKLCNSHHLNGNCANDEACPYDHAPVSPGVLNCLRQLVTNTPCAKRGVCRSLRCVQGHICQRSDCKHRGGKAYCKFPVATHAVDLSPAYFVPGTYAPWETSLCDTDPSGSPYYSSQPSSMGGFTNSNDLHAVPVMSDSEPGDLDSSADAL